MCEPKQAYEWATRTGYLPVSQFRPDGFDGERYAWRFRNDLSAARQPFAPWPWAPNLFRIQRDILEPRLEEAVIENRDPEAVLREARELARRPW
jgi:sn-glycerol 3-phosphate transport system substrate-binding protein